MESEMEEYGMKKWCGIQKSDKSNRYRVVVPMLGDYISDDMMVESYIGGRILTKFLTLEEAKEACMEFNKLHEKYN